jgi:hypothetical protein
MEEKVQKRRGVRQEEEERIAPSSRNQAFSLEDILSEYL